MEAVMQLYFRKEMTEKADLTWFMFAEVRMCLLKMFIFEIRLSGLCACSKTTECV